jgi:hypothetical protein
MGKALSVDLYLEKLYKQTLLVPKTNSFYFEAYLHDTIRLLQQRKTAYAFRKDQLDALKKVFSDLSITCVDSIYIITREYPK